MRKISGVDQAAERGAAGADERRHMARRPFCPKSRKGRTVIAVVGAPARHGVDRAAGGKRPHGGTARLRPEGVDDIRPLLGEQRREPVVAAAQAGLAREGIFGAVGGQRHHHGGRRRRP